MMAMAKEGPTPSWRNVAAWSAVGAIFYILIVSGGALLLHENGVRQAFPSNEVVAKLGLGLIFTVAVLGFSSRKQPLNLRTFRNYLILNAAALSFFLLVIWGFSAFGVAEALVATGVAERAASGLGLALIFLASLGGFFVANAHRGAGLIENDEVAEDLRERGRLYFCGFAWMAACGLLLIVLGFGGPEGVLSPAAALAGALVLVAVLAVLGIVAWRLSDELGRTLSHETGNMTFYLILVIGGGWAMLAHLGFVAGPAPIDWLTIFIVLQFAASFIVLGRRKLLTR
jgi:hypothetical protein